LRISIKGRAAHSGENIEGGRNALVALAQLVDGVLPASGWADLLAFARESGADLYGKSLGLPPRDPLWGGFTVNVAVLKPADAGWGVPAGDGVLGLIINVRRPPPMKGPELKERLDARVREFNQRTGAALQAGGYYKDEPLVFDPNARIVRRLIDIYARATGAPAPVKPAISGGGTYAKRVPNAIAFGMWFREAGPYPGHDVDEKVPVEYLQRGTRVLIEALSDIARGPRIVEPLKP
jgi:succinyl-diaminopimelate desuccinylase